MPLAPAACTGCTVDLADAPVEKVQRRQVFDAPPPEPSVVEFQAQYKRCLGCGTENAGVFLPQVKSRAQYGPEILARTADLVLGHYVPTFRSAALIRELCGIRVSTGFVGLAASARCGPAGSVHGPRPEPAQERAGRARRRDLDHGVRLHRVPARRLHGTSDGDAHRRAHQGRHRRRRWPDRNHRRTGARRLRRLPAPDQVLHAWCGAHLLRDLRWIHQADPAGQLWAKAMGDLLADSHHQAAAARTAGRSALGEDELAHLHRRFTGALARAHTDNEGRKTPLAKDSSNLVNAAANTAHADGPVPPPAPLFRHSSL